MQIFSCTKIAYVKYVRVDRLVRASAMSFHIYVSTTSEYSMFLKSKIAIDAECYLGDCSLSQEKCHYDITGDRSGCNG